MRDAVARCGIIAQHAVANQLRQHSTLVSSYLGRDQRRHQHEGEICGSADGVVYGAFYGVKLLVCSKLRTSCSTVWDSEEPVTF